MKTICLISFTLFSAIALAENFNPPSLQEAKAQTVVKKEMGPRMRASTKAYKKAKKACLERSEGHLKGKQLADCIVSYQKEAK